jgi:hypothetical protein
MPNQNLKLIVPRVLLIVFLMFALLLTGCSEGFSLDIDIGGGGETEGVNNGMLFTVLVVVLIVVVAVAVMGKR